MDCRCLRCDSRFQLSESEAARCREFFDALGNVAPAEVVGICPGCWKDDTPKAIEKPLSVRPRIPQ